MHLIEAVGQLLDAGFDPRLRGDGCSLGAGGGIGIGGARGLIRMNADGFDHFFRLGFQFAPPILPRIGQRQLQPGESGSPESILRWKISSGVKRLQLRCEPDGHRPAARAGHHLRGHHVKIIQVGALLAVDFDIHKMGIHDRSDFVIFKKLRAP